MKSPITTPTANENNIIMRNTPITLLVLILYQLQAYSRYTCILLPYKFWFFSINLCLTYSSQSIVYSQIRFWWDSTNLLDILGKISDLGNDAFVQSAGWVRIWNFVKFVWCWQKQPSLQYCTLSLRNFRFILNSSDIASIIPFGSFIGTLSPRILGLWRTTASMVVSKCCSKRRSSFSIPSERSVFVCSKKISS